MKRQILLLLSFLLAWLGGQVCAAEPLVIPGTGTNEILLRNLAEAFNAQHSGQAVSIPPSVGTEGGIHLVGTGQALLGRVARPPEGPEQTYGLRFLLIARDPVVFAVGGNVNVQNLTCDQLRDIFSGKITDWREVSGNPAIIRVLVRQPNETSLRVIQKHLKQFQDLNFAPQSKILYHDYEMVELLPKYKNSIGWMTASAAAATSVKPIAIDNVEPTLQNVLAGDYTLVVNNGLVYKENALNQSASAFLDFIFSEQGKKIIEKLGAIPVPRN